VLCGWRNQKLRYALRIVIVWFRCNNRELSHVAEGRGVSGDRLGVKASDVTICRALLARTCICIHGAAQSPAERCRWSFPNKPVSKHKHTRILALSSFKQATRASKPRQSKARLSAGPVKHNVADSSTREFALSSPCAVTHDGMSRYHPPSSIIEIIGSKEENLRAHPSYPSPISGPIKQHRTVHYDSRDATAGKRSLKGSNNL